MKKAIKSYESLLFLFNIILTNYSQINRFVDKIIITISFGIYIIHEKQVRIIFNIMSGFHIRSIRK